MAITKEFTYSVDCAHCVPQSYSLDLTSDYYLFGSLKKISLWEYYNIHDKNLQNTSTKVQNTLKNIYAFSNVVVKFCEIFISPTGKQYTTKNSRHYFLTAYIFKTVLIIKTKYILQILVITHNSKIHILCTSGINTTKFRNTNCFPH
jgi:hypothetical protein